MPALSTQSCTGRSGYCVKLLKTRRGGRNPGRNWLSRVFPQRCGACPRSTSADSSNRRCRFLSAHDVATSTVPAARNRPRILQLDPSHNVVYTPGSALVRKLHTNSSASFLESTQHPSRAKLPKKSRTCSTLLSHTCLFPCQCLDSSPEERTYGCQTDVTPCQEPLSRSLVAESKQALSC